LYRYAAGRVKITDFGLSKIMEERAGMGDLLGDTGMELTSQSAVGGCTG
jgi:tousled-like kinase